MLRAEGEAGCAHCAQMGAVVSCQICTLLICEKCAADWSTCSAPSGRVIRLGLTGRVRDVDPRGHRALVTQFLHSTRVLDLRTLRVVGELPSEVMRSRRSFAPRLLSTGHVVYAEFASSDDVLVYEGLRKLQIGEFDPERIIGPKDDPPRRASAVSASGDLVSYVGEQEMVHVYGPGDPRTYAPLPRKVIHSTCIDGERRLLVCGTWSEIAVHRIDDEKLHPVAHVSTELPGNVTWLGLAGGVLAAAVFENARGTHVEVRRLGETSSIGNTFRSFSPAFGFQTAALSRDGRYLAVAYAARLDVLDLDTGNDTTFEDHTDRINLVRFGADHLLISADTDNRIVLRPRTPRGYAGALIPAAVSG